MELSRSGLSCHSKLIEKGDCSRIGKITGVLYIVVRDVNVVVLAINRLRSWCAACGQIE